MGAVEGKAGTYCEDGVGGMNWLARRDGVPDGVRSEQGAGNKRFVASMVREFWRRCMVAGIWY